LSYKELAWEWDESPCDYFWALNSAKTALQQAVNGPGQRFTLFRIEERQSDGQWVVLEEINTTRPENSN
jgi:hypothetical protein